jgi:gliding motility-associated-like protein
LKVYTGLCLLTVLFFSSVNTLQAQLCQGSFGDPLVNITFGSGPNPGSQLAAATTNYQYVATDCPNDGFYTVRNNTTSCFGNSWFTLTADHTGNTNGYFMLVNASIQPSAFYVDTVRGLCGNSTYEFASWIMNMSILQPNGCGGNPIQPNITFSIEKTDGTVLQTANSNNIPPTTTAVWNRYGLVFTTPVGVQDIVLRMFNNATGGCGNDIALDDITFRPCGPQLTPAILGLNTTTATICEGNTQTLSFTCTVSPGFNNPVFQWQQSFNGSAFADMPGENGTVLVRNYTAASAAGVYRYRLSVAETGNLGSPPCRISSENITVNIKPKPVVTAVNNGPFCTDGSIIITAAGAASYQWSGPNAFTYNGNPVLIPNAQLINAGPYSVIGKDADGCENTAATAVVVNPSPAAFTLFSDSTICAGTSLQLSASGGGSYQWLPAAGLTGAALPNPVAAPTDSVQYRVVVTNQFNCTDTAYTSINVIKLPVVNAGPDRIIVANKSIEINGSIAGAFSNFYWGPLTNIANANTLSPTINPPAEAKYYLTAVAPGNCGIVSDTMYVKIYSGIYIPNAFTPNGDSKNDTWNIPVLEAYPLHTLLVFNRYGQIIFERKQGLKGWDGKYKGQDQPAGAYTYIIDLKTGAELIKGTVLIIR